MAQPKLEVTYVDLPDVSETFADSAERINFDGSTWRFEFTVTRVDEPKSPDVLTGKKLPVCRLVMTARGGLDFYGKLKSFVEAMEKQGHIRQVAQTAAAVPPASGKPT